MSADLADRLRDYLRRQLADPTLEVVDLDRLSGGASRETWAFVAVGGDGDGRRLILRRDPPGAARAGMSLEARLIDAAGRAGVPVPSVVAASDDPADLGTSFLVMERVDGETLPRRVLREPELEPARAGLARRCGEVLAALHSVPTGDVSGLEAPDQLAHYREVFDGLGGGRPVLEAAFRWLHENRPATSAQVIVHGDFRNGNLMVAPDGLRAVLDWELAHLGDPLEDLSWLCVKSWRFGSPLPVGGFGSYDDLVAGYEAAGGRPVDRQALRWWEVLGNLKWGVMCMMQASAHASGMLRSVELAAIGRRVCEVEWDLLDLLGLAGPRWPAPEPGPPPTGDLHGWPTAAELVTAVKEFLAGDVMGNTSGRVRFHARVAVNVLSMVEREMASQGSDAAHETGSLAALGVSSEAELAARIRDGSVDAGHPEVAAHLRASTAARLAVSNPGWFGDVESA